MTWWLCLLTCASFLSTEEQEESIYNLYISEVRNIRLQLESCEERLVRQIRTPMERDDLRESVFRISEQEVSLCKRLFYLGEEFYFKTTMSRCFQCSQESLWCTLKGQESKFKLVLVRKKMPINDDSVSFPLIHTFIFKNFNGVHMKQAEESRPVLTMICRIYMRLM